MFHNFTRVFHRGMDLRFADDTREETGNLWMRLLSSWIALIDGNNIKTWSQMRFLSYWRLASHIATLPPERWVRRILRPTFSLGVSHFNPAAGTRGDGLMLL